MPTSRSQHLDSDACDLCGRSPFQSLRVGLSPSGNEWTFRLCIDCEARLPPEPTMSDEERDEMWQAMLRQWPEDERRTWNNMTREELLRILSEAQ